MKRIVAGAIVAAALLGVCSAGDRQGGGPTQAAGTQRPDPETARVVYEQDGARLSLFLMDGAAREVVARLEGPEDGYAGEITFYEQDRLFIEWMHGYDYDGVRMGLDADAGRATLVLGKLSYSLDFAGGEAALEIIYRPESLDRLMATSPDGAVAVYDTQIVAMGEGRRGEYVAYHRDTGEIVYLADRHYVEDAVVFCGDGAVLVSRIYSMAMADVYTGEALVAPDAAYFTGAGTVDDPEYLILGAVYDAENGEALVAYREAVLQEQPDEYVERIYPIYIARFDGEGMLCGARRAYDADWEEIRIDRGMIALSTVRMELDDGVLEIYPACGEQALGAVDLSAPAGALPPLLHLSAPAGAALLGRLEDVDDGDFPAAGHGVESRSLGGTGRLVDSADGGLLLHSSWPISAVFWTGRTTLALELEQGLYYGDVGLDYWSFDLRTGTLAPMELAYPPLPTGRDTPSYSHMNDRNMWHRGERYFVTTSPEAQGPEQKHIFRETADGFDLLVEDAHAYQFRDGALYYKNDGTGNLYRLDLETGAAGVVYTFENPHSSNFDEYFEGA